METHHRHLSDREFIGQLESGLMDPCLFNHEAHIRLAWLYLTTTDFETGLKCISKAIRRLDDQHSSGTKYHHTITVAFSLRIYLLIQEKRTNSWKQFIEANPELNFPKKLLRQHYSEEILYSDIARRTFITPDKPGVHLQAEYINATCFLKIPLHL